METLLKVQGIRRGYGTTQVLRSLDFELVRGDLLGLLGPNGAGKTTCLRILTGNLAPSAGHVRVLGHDLAQHPLKAKRHIGYLPERAPIYPEMRVDEYLDFCARLRGIPAGSIPRNIARIKSRCGLEQVGRRLLGKLSKGYRQRAGLAQALLHEPDLVFLDEPTDGLDPVQVREVRELVAELAPRSGIIISSHVLSEVQAMCNRVIILRDGRMLHDGRIDTAPTDSTLGPLRVRLRRNCSAAQLARMATIGQAERLAESPSTVPGSVFRVQPAAGVGADDIAGDLVQAGLGLMELRPERTELEDIFFRGLMQDDDATAAAINAPVNPPLDTRIDEPAGERAPEPTPTTLKEQP